MVFQFGTQQRSDLKFRWACELVRNGRLGKLKEIQVGVPGGKIGPDFPEQPVPAEVDWDRWVGPAPMTSFSVDKLRRDNREHHELLPRHDLVLGVLTTWTSPSGAMGRMKLGRSVWKGRRSILTKAAAMVC